LLILEIIIQRKEVITMKIAKSILAAVLLTVASGSLNAMAADGVISKEQLTPGSYCHQKFAAIDERTLGDARPVLTDPSDGDIIDYYGPCSEKPLGKDQIQQQERDEREQHDLDAR
jgi:hypothetical protein